jgi:hypothetical protein
MDAVTYPDPRVKAELARWLQRRVDVAVEPKLAASFGVAAIPTAVVVDGEGRIRDRIVGFVEAGAFLERLVRSRENQPSASRATLASGPRQAKTLVAGKPLLVIAAPYRLPLARRQEGGMIRHRPSTEFNTGSDSLNSRSETWTT